MYILPLPNLSFSSFSQPDFERGVEQLLHYVTVPEDVSLGRTSWLFIIHVHSDVLANNNFNSQLDDYDIRKKIAVSLNLSPNRFFLIQSFVSASTSPFTPSCLTFSLLFDMELFELWYRARQAYVFSQFEKKHRPEVPRTHFTWTLMLSYYLIVLTNLPLVREDGG